MVLEIGEETSSHSKRKGGSSSKKIFVDTHSRGRLEEFFLEKLLSHPKGECWRRNK
jgi:hypothetical protein